MVKKIVYNVDECEFRFVDRVKIDIKKIIDVGFYDSEEFHEYHKRFADEVYQLFLKKGDKILGYCYLGIRENELRAPYSSPFSMICFNKNYKVSDVFEFVGALKKFAEFNKYNKIRFTLPSDMYNSELLGVLSSCFFSAGFGVKVLDINNYFELDDYENIEKHLEKCNRKTRRNYLKGVNNKLELLELDDKNFGLAYDCIKLNREQNSYPLKISKKQMSDIINMKNSNVRSFVVKKDDIILGAAIIFDVTEDISQVVYWGDDANYRQLRIMEFMTIKIFDIYKKLGKKYLDIGPSSEDGLINQGLYDFKKSIGCNSNVKLTFVYEV